MTDDKNVGFEVGGAAGDQLCFDAPRLGRLRRWLALAAFDIAGEQDAPAPEIEPDDDAVLVGVGMMGGIAVKKIHARAGAERNRRGVHHLARAHGHGTVAAAACYCRKFAASRGSGGRIKRGNRQK